MEETGTCAICGADNVAVNGDEKCEDCADVKDDDGNDVPEGMEMSDDDM